MELLAKSLHREHRALSRDLICMWGSVGPQGFHLPSGFQKGEAEIPLKSQGFKCSRSWEMAQLHGIVIESWNGWVGWDLKDGPVPSRVMGLV